MSGKASQYDVQVSFFKGADVGKVKLRDGAWAIPLEDPAKFTFCLINRTGTAVPVQMTYDPPMPAFTIPAGARTPIAGKLINPGTHVHVVFHPQGTPRPGETWFEFIFGQQPEETEEEVPLTFEPVLPVEEPETLRRSKRPVGGRIYH